MRTWPRKLMAYESIPAAASAGMKFSDQHLHHHDHANAAACSQAGMHALTGFEPNKRAKLAQNQQCLEHAVAVSKTQWFGIRIRCCAVKSAPAGEGAPCSVRCTMQEEHCGAA